MFFDRLFLRFSLVLFCSIFCALEMQAVPPGGDLPTSNISIKGKRRLPLGDPRSPSEAPSATAFFITEPSLVGVFSAKENHNRRSKKHKTYHKAPDQNEVFWDEAIRAADALEEEYYRSHPRQNSVIAMTDPIDDATFWDDAIRAADALEEEYYRSHPQQTPLTDDATFWDEAIRVADALEEEYSQSRQTKTFLTSSAPGNDSLSSQNTPSLTSSGTQETNTSLFDLTSEEDAALYAAVIAAEEKYSQDQLSQPSPAPFTYGMESSVSQMSSFPSSLSESRSDEDPEDHFEELRPSLTSSGTQETNTSLFDLTSEEDAALYAAVIAAEEKYSQDQLSQPSPAPFTYGMESSVSQMSSLPSSLSESRSDEDPEDHFEGLRYSHLTTPQDHQNYLIDAINSAEHSILITSYTLSADMMGSSGLFKAMQSACYRGVRIYLYANKIRLGDRQFDALERLRNLMFSKAKIHSKLVVVDNKQITCGSYNWLGDPWRGTSRDASLILESSDLSPAVDNIWHILKKYGTVDFNPHSLRRVENTLKSLNPLEIQFDNPENSPSILNTPYQHGDLFERCFEQAQRQLTICTPFITGDIGYLEDILPRNRLRSFLNSGRKLNIFYREADDKVQMLKNHLDQILSGPYYRLSQNVTLTSVKGLHRKTMFADDNLYIEGSYNWLSSARSLKGPYYFMETSLVFTGTWAQELIQKFPFSVEPQVPAI